MVLPGYVLMSQGTQIHIAAWPGSEREAPPAPISLWERQILLSRAFASQAAAYVIAVGGLCSAEDVPEAYRDWAYPATGDSCIIDPRGEIIAGPAEGETILIADGTMEHIFAAKSACDVAGHYSRPDLFQLRINQTPYQRVVETPGPDDAPKQVTRLCASENLRASVQVIQREFRENLHSHRDTDGLWIVLRGRVSFFGPDDVLLGDFGRMEGIFIPRNFRYRYESTGEETLEVLQVLSAQGGWEPDRTEHAPRSEGRGTVSRHDARHPAKTAQGTGK